MAQEETDDFLAFPLVYQLSNVHLALCHIANQMRGDGREGQTTLAGYGGNVEPLAKEGEADLVRVCFWSLLLAFLTGTTRLGDGVSEEQTGFGGEVIANLELCLGLAFVLE